MAIFGQEEVVFLSALEETEDETVNTKAGYTPCINKYL